MTRRAADHTCTYLDRWPAAGIATAYPEHLKSCEPRASWLLTTVENTSIPPETTDSAPTTHPSHTPYGPYALIGKRRAPQNSIAPVAPARPCLPRLRALALLGHRLRRARKAA